MSTTRDRIPLTLGIVALALGACAVFPLLAPTTSPTFSADTVVTDVKGGDRRYVLVHVSPPAEGAYTTRSTVHHWTATDIYEYTATLKVDSGSGFVDLSPAVTVTIPRKVNPMTAAAFTNLKHGLKYEVLLTARGNPGGTAATTVLNTVPAAATFDFTGAQDVEDTPSANLAVTFDPVAFNGSGTTNVTTPADGTYQNPSSAETGTAQ